MGPFLPVKTVSALVKRWYCKARTDLTVETASGVKKLKLYTRSGEVSSVSVDMGKVNFSAADLPAVTD